MKIIVFIIGMIIIYLLMPNKVAALGIVLVLAGAGFMYKGSQAAQKMIGQQKQASAPSLNNMNKVCLPKIQARLPEFTLESYAPKAARAVMSVHGAITAQDLALLRDCDEQLTQQIGRIIDQLRREGIVSVFDEEEVTEVVIKSCREERGEIQITFQCAVSSLRYKLKEGQLFSGSTTEKRQAKYNITLDGQSGLFTYYEKNN